MIEHTDVDWGLEDFEDIAEGAMELRQQVDEDVFFRWGEYEFVVTEDSTLESIQADYEAQQKLQRPANLLDQVDDFEVGFGGDVDAMACALFAFNQAVMDQPELLGKTLEVVSEIERYKKKQASEAQESPSTPER